jgi:hypothetical protein
VASTRRSAASISEAAAWDQRTDRAPTVRVTLPNGRSSIRWRSASGALLKGEGPVTGGRDLAAGDQRQDRGARLGLLAAEAANSENPLTRASFHTRSVTRRVVSVPAE